MSVNRDDEHASAAPRADGPASAGTAGTLASEPRLAAVRSSVPLGDEAGVAELAARVAAKVREHRRLRDMSLDQLAQRTGVSRAGLSQIESCKTNPSLSILWKIAAGLGITFAELIGAGPTGMSVLRRNDAEILRSADRKLESRPLMPPSGSNQLEIYELRLAARSRHASEPHGRGTRELVIAVTGTLRMTLGGQVESLAAGDSLLFDANQPHVYENPGGREATYHDLIIYPWR